MIIPLQHVFRVCAALNFLFASQGQAERVYSAGRFCRLGRFRLASLTWSLLIVLEESSRLESIVMRGTSTSSSCHRESELMTVFCVLGDLVGRARHYGSHNGHCSTYPRCDECGYPE